ncbi:MAG: SxtJ family membrane protein [Bdellovibrionales bacterium]
MTKVKPVDPRKFGKSVGLVFLAIAAVLFFLGKTNGAYVTGVIGSFLIAMMPFPQILGPISRGWMKVGAVIGQFNMRLFLIIGFYFIITPIALFFRLIGRDALTRKFDPKATSYFSPMELSPHYKKPF